MLSVPNISTNKKRLAAVVILFFLAFLSIQLLYNYDGTRISWPYPPSTKSVAEESAGSSDKELELQKTIPPLIHQTWMNKEISPESQTWIDMNPEYTYTIYDDADADEFVKTNFSPDIYEVYSNMPKVILKADFFRYLVLYAKGGTYADVDTRCLKKIDDWTDGKKGIRMIVGIEADVQDRKDWCEWFARRVQLVQWSMSSVAYHPAMKAVVDRIMRHSSSFMRRLEVARAKGQNLNIMDWTGPGVWTDAIFEYIDLTYNITWEELQSLEHGMQIDDIYVLPITGFSPGVGHMGSKPVEDPEAKVQHLFHGVWKNDTHSRRSRHWHRSSFI